MQPAPTQQQLAWQDSELSMFLHFGINTFTDREWGEGDEDPQLFAPTHLDAAQWVEIARNAGFKYVILTAKHHDGFCLWPSKFTDHSVASSPWLRGKGDVVREFSEACQAAGVKMGLYLSPWDRHSPLYGDSAAYNSYYLNQLDELMTQYGEVAEVWFDGACGEGQNGKRQVYDWQAYYSLIRRRQPEVLIAIMGPDIRWVGNEDGYASETEWSVHQADPIIHAGIEGEVWWPSECDVSIRPGWFWHESENDKVKSLEHLVDIYFKSVGRNSVLLLNVPPDNRGLIAEPDQHRLKEFRREIDRLFANDLALGKPTTRTKSPPSVEINLGEPLSVSIVSIQEIISEGQRVEEYIVEALTDSGWTLVSRGTTIGHKKLDRFRPINATKARLTITASRDVPIISSFSVY